MNYQWCINDNCDQECKYCSSWNKKCKKREVGRTLIDLILRKIINFDTLAFFSISGGDPLVSKNFNYLVTKLLENHIKWEIMGCPFHITDEVCQKLVRYKCLAYRLAIDGLKNTHDSFHIPGSFDATISAIKKLQLYNIPVVIRMTVDNKNILDVCDVLQLCANLKVKSFSFIRRCKDKEEYSVDILPEEYRELLGKVDSLDRILQQNGWKGLVKQDHLWELYANEKYGKKYPVSGFVRGCGCGLNHMTICPDGDVMVCGRLAGSIVGNLISDNMSTIWNERMAPYRNFGNFNACSKCELWRNCRGCPAVAKAKTGNYYDKDPQCWKNI